MNEQNFEVLKYTGLAFLLVIASGLVAYYLTPDTMLGKAVRSAVPVLTGVGAGLWIHFRFRDILDFDE